MPATPWRPQLSFKSTQISAAAKVRSPGKQSWTSDALHNPYTPSTSQQIEHAFTPGELQQALPNLKAGKAAGHDYITTDLLNTCRQRRHQVYCLSLTAAGYRSGARNPGEGRGSYQSIMLSSTIGNVLERLIANHLSWWLEETQLTASGGRFSARGIKPSTVTIHLRWISINPAPTHQCYFLRLYLGIR